MRIFEPMMNNPKDLLSGTAPALNSAYPAPMARDLDHELVASWAVLMHPATSPWHVLSHQASCFIRRAVMCPLSKRQSSCLCATWQRCDSAGDHTRSIQVSTPSLAAGGIMQYAKVRLACLGCKAMLSKGETTLCQHCKSKVRTPPNMSHFCATGMQHLQDGVYSLSGP